MMNGVLVGFGEVARNGHWPAYEASRDARIVAVVDRLAERRALAESVIPGVRTFETLEAITGPIDFADVCTPPALHQEPTLAALDRGWHVLCEKPLVLRSDLLAPIRERAVANGLAVVPAHNWKYAPILRRAGELLREGTIGSLRHVDILTSRTQAAVTVGGAYNWRTDPAMAGGGILMDHGWHAIYLALHWFGEQPTGVSAELGRRSGAGVETDVDLTLTFPSGDARIVLTWNGTARRNAVRLIGERGELDAADDVLHVRTGAVRSEQMAAALSAGSHHADWFTAMLPDVVDAFRHPEHSRPLFEEAATCLRVIETAYALAPATF
jgi:predicted dehydrogenase